MQLFRYFLVLHTVHNLMRLVVIYQFVAVLLTNICFCVFLFLWFALRADDNYLGIVRLWLNYLQWGCALDYCIVSKR